jgi:hypothetical protein
MSRAGAEKPGEKWQGKEGKGARFTPTCLLPHKGEEMRKGVLIALAFSQRL